MAILFGLAGLWLVLWVIAAAARAGNTAEAREQLEAGALQVASELDAAFGRIESAIADLTGEVADLRTEIAALRADLERAELERAELERKENP